MFACLYGKCRARKVARMLCNSLLQDAWDQSMSPGATVILKRGGITVMIIPARIRLFDQVIVVREDSEVWFPLLSRCRIRSCVRARMAILAYATLIPYHNRKRDEPTKS